MTEKHPITPPPELVQQWLGEFFGCTVSGELSDSERYLATQAARWGADTELEACCEWLKGTAHIGIELELINARRPKPPSLAEQAMEALQDQIDRSFKVTPEAQERADLIRRALERLQELE